ncbi:MAG TPA: NAD(P)H-binding protein [Pseudolysinimonas sp.]|jgi:uncharacterized protein YbjT (DUF2867 family)
MKIVVAGGTGLIGTRVVEQLQAGGHDVLAASRATGVNTYTTEGLSEALEGAEVVIDTTNSPYTDYDGAIEFFETSTFNLLSFGRAEGVRHHLALSVVGTQRLATGEGMYFLAKAQQEALIRESGMAYSIVHGTQFFEFLDSIADFATDGGRIPLTHAFVQPIAADDIAAAVVDAALSAPSNGTVEHAGPEVFRLDELVEKQLRSRRDPREVEVDPLGRYFGAQLAERDLLPDDGAIIAPTHFADWLRAGA